MWFPKERRSFPPKLTVFEFDGRDLTSSDVGWVVLGRDVSPLTWFGVRLDLSDAVCHECLERFRWSIDPVKRHHRVSPVEDLLRLEVVELLDRAGQSNAHDAGGELQPGDRFGLEWRHSGLRSHEVDFDRFPFLDSQVDSRAHSFLAGVAERVNLERRFRFVPVPAFDLDQRNDENLFHPLFPAEANVFRENVVPVDFLVLPDLLKDDLAANGEW